jgi:O-antigen/teichoic acid export membrane protein
MLTSAIAQLNLVTAMLRFLPRAGRSSRRFVVACYGLTLALSALVALVVLVVLARFIPRLAPLVANVWWIGCFVVAVMAWSIFTLQDAVLTGVRRASWVPADNSVFGVAKIVFLVLLGGALPELGIFLSWVLAAAIAVVVISGAVVPRLLRAHVASAGGAVSVLAPRAVARFVAADYVGGLAWIAAITLIPIDVAQRLGGEANAYYSLSWVIVLPLYTISAATASSLVVSILAEPDRAEVPRRVLLQTAILVVPAALVLAAGAPFFLALFGPAYREHGTTVLRLLALSTIPALLCTLAFSVWRVQSRLGLLVWVRVVAYGAVVLLSWVLMGPYGIEGPPIAWLIVQTLAAAAILALSPEVVTGRPMRPRAALLKATLHGRNAAVATRLPAVVSPMRRRSRMRRAPGDPAIETILAGLGAGSERWTVHKVVPTVTDRLVLLVGPVPGAPHAAVKVAASEQAGRALRAEQRVLEELRADPRLAPLRPLLPAQLAAGVAGGRLYVVERAMPGVCASLLLGSGRVPDWFVGRLAEPIAALHRLTAVPLTVGDEELAAWVREPLAVLHAQIAGLRRAPRPLEPLREELEDALRGRTVTATWIHGDYWAGNVLLDPRTATVSGIVDWEVASAPALPALDLVQLILATEAAVHRRELGHVVATTVGRSRRARRSARLAEAFEQVGLAPEELRPLVLLAWLRHVSGILTTSGSYARNRIWTALNVELPLHEAGR